MYITDSEGGGVYAVLAAGDTLVEVLPPGTYIFPNGITQTDDGRVLFLGHA